MRLMRLGLLVGGCVFALGLAALISGQRDPLAGLRRTEHQAALLSGAKPDGIRDWITLQWLRLVSQKTTQQLWERCNLETEEQIRLGNLARLQMPLTNSAADPGYSERLIHQLTRSATTLYPNGQWSVGYNYLTKSLEITAPSQMTNQWIQLIARLQAAH